MVQHFETATAKEQFYFSETLPASRRSCVGGGQLLFMYHNHHWNNKEIFAVAVEYHVRFTKKQGVFLSCQTHSRAKFLLKIGTVSAFIRPV